MIERGVYIYVYISRGGEKMEEHRQVVDSALTVGFCLMKRREADSAAVMYLESR